MLLKKRRRFRRKKIVETLKKLHLEQKRHRLESRQKKTKKKLICDHV